mgnify:CR=1 FL=1
MVKQRRYPSLTSEPSVSPFKIILTVLALLFIAVFVFGTTMIFKELRAISDGQQVLILKLTADSKPSTIAEAVQTEGQSDDAISKMEFVKFRNETRKAIRDLAKELRLVQTKLRMKRTVLDDY